MLPGKGEEGGKKKGSCRCLLQMPHSVYLRPAKSVFLAEENIQKAKQAQC